MSKKTKNSRAGNRAKWKKVSAKKEKKIIADFDAGVVRNQIIREHKIPAGQFYHIIRKTEGLIQREN